MTNYKSGILAFVFIIHSLITGPFLSHNRKKCLKEGFSKLLITGFSSLIPVISIHYFFLSKGNLNEAVFWGFLYNFGYIESGKGAFSSFINYRKNGYFILLTLPACIAAMTYISVSIKNSGCQAKQSLLMLNILILLFLHSGFASQFMVQNWGAGYGHYSYRLFLRLRLRLLKVILFFRI